MKNLEKALKKLYQNEAEHFDMPDENDILAIRNGKALVPAAKDPKRTLRYGPLIASAAVLLFILAAVILQLPDNEPPATHHSISSTKPTQTESTSPPSTDPSNTIPTQKPTDPAKSYPDLSTLTLSQWLDSDRVVWLAGSPTKGNISTGKTIELGQTLIDEKLISAFNENAQDTVYAVMVDFTSMRKDDYVFEDKKLSEWTAEKDSLIALGKMVDAKLIAQKINQAKEAYYFSMLENFEEKFASMGLGIYHEERGYTIDNCIFYTFATRSQIEEFVCAPSEAFIFSPAVRFK